MPTNIPEPTNEFCVNLQQEVTITFNNLLDEKAKPDHRLRLLRLQSKITVGLVRINSIPEYEMSPTIRYCRVDLMGLQDKIKHLLDLTTPARCDKTTQTESMPKQEEGT
ncbi:hypothetical protein CAEBREN_13244 [Caenorhabditis brenneri]|uniref:Uncharacterized protein n=1 Tax=Caenorhabditis brenneri TaxID=135651 RepID=G0PHH5_CAEBE|nr:hypothetical protein CAEBREN_13244 [Caenorhabditis brenneri]